MPDRHPGHPPSPEPGRLKPNSPGTESARCGSTAAPVAAQGSAWCHVGRRAAAAGERCGRHLQSAALRRRPEGGVAARAPVVPPRSPQLRPRRIARGTCGGVFKRWARKPAHCFGCLNCKRDPTHPPPLAQLQYPGSAGSWRSRPAAVLQDENLNDGRRAAAVQAWLLSAAVNETGGRAVSRKAVRCTSDSVLR